MYYLLCFIVGPVEKIKIVRLDIKILNITTKLHSPKLTSSTESFWRLKKEAGSRSEDKIIQYYKTIM